jgi:CheY-like chemotaxis protein
MPEGGTLRFIASAPPRLPEQLRPDLDDDASADVPFVAITVQDSGVGMSDETKERAFEPFFTTKGAGRGTGLGLSTVYGFVKQSRGAVDIASRPGHGTAVTLYIPSAGESADLPADDDAVVTADLPAGLRVLLVEDDAEVRAVVEHFLAALECVTTICPNAEDALQALAGAADGFDVLLSDISLGAGMRGTELAALAQEQLPGMAVLLMSGFSSELLEADSTSPPSWELLRKPYGRDELKAALAKLIAAKSDQTSRAD